MLLRNAALRSAFVRAAARYVPELQPGDVESAFAGVRAQALGRDGRLVDDFVFSQTERALHLRNAPTGLMKNLGYGRDYQYAHDTEQKVADMQCLPDSLRDRVYYHPTNEGVEKRIRERLEEIKRLKQPASSRAPSTASTRTANRTKRESET